MSDIKTVKVENYNQGKNINLIIQERQVSFLFWLVNSDKRVVGDIFEVSIVSAVDTHMTIELDGNLPEVIEPDIYKLRVSAKCEDGKLSEHIELNWKEVEGAKVANDPFKELEFQVTNNKIVIKRSKGQIGAIFNVFDEKDEEISEYRVGFPTEEDGTVEIKIEDIFEGQPITEEKRYEIFGQARYESGYSDGTKVIWIPMKNTDSKPAAPVVLKVHLPPPQKGEDERTPQERLDNIKKDLEKEIAELNNAQTPTKKKLWEAGEMIREMRNTLKEIAKDQPDEYTKLKSDVDLILEKIEELSGICRGFNAVIYKKRKPAKNATPAQATASATVPTMVPVATPVPTTVPPTLVTAPTPSPVQSSTPTMVPVATPAPATAAATVPVTAPVPTPVPAPTTPSLDLGPTNNRIDALEDELADLALQLANKASAEDLAKLSGSVSGLDRQVTSLKGQMSGLKTAVENTAKTCNNGFDRLTAAVDALASQQVSSTTPATPAQATASTTVPLAPSTVQSTVPTVPTQVTAVNPVSKGKKKSGRESVNFFALVLGIVLGVLAVIAIFFYATRSQSIDAERIGASDAKSAAVAEMENARRLQMETMDKMHNLQQNVEGYRRQTFVTPPPPLSPTVTNITVVTNMTVATNTLAPSINTNSAVTNTFGKLSYHLDRPIEGISLGDTFEMQPCIEAYWFPSWTQNLYGYRKARGFNGYLEPR